MTPHKKFSLIFWLVAGSILIISYLLLEQSQSKLIRLEAIRVAEVVANQVLMDRKAYTELLVQKLEREGRGAAVNSHEIEGFIPLPAQFVRAVADNVSANNAELYKYRLLSAWNLNPNQGVVGDYEKGAWTALLDQEREAKSHGQDWDWAPVVSFEYTQEGLVLRYMRADLASAEACVVCHNAYEQRPEIMAIRQTEGMLPGKHWNQGDLMGAVHVDVPLIKFEVVAAEDRVAMFIALLVTCVAGFVVLYRLIYVQVIKPVEDEARAKNSFLAKMSHEIRTPLNAVVNMGEFLGETKLSKGQQQHLRMLNTSAQELLCIVDDILDFSKAQAGELKVESIPFDLVELVKSCTESFFIEAMHKGVALDLDIARDSEGYFIGDPARIRQVLQNLIHNAVKFTEEGEITVSLEKHKLGIRLSVEDTGVGIADDRKGTIFEDFVQGDNSISRAYGGTGLGLTICKSLVELMGGKLELESNIGAGTKVYFELALEPALQLEEASEVVSSEEQHFDGVRILIVEDNPVNQMVAKAVLTKWGVTAIVAVDGQKALDNIAEKGIPDAILMDYHMPVMNGLQATRLLRKQGITIPIIALSAAALEEEIQQCFDAGMDAFLPKPLDRKALNNLLVKYLKSKIKKHEPQPNL